MSNVEPTDNPLHLWHREQILDDLETHRRSLATAILIHSALKAWHLRLWTLGLLATALLAASLLFATEPYKHYGIVTSVVSIIALAGVYTMLLPALTSKYWQSSATLLKLSMQYFEVDSFLHSDLTAVPTEKLAHLRKTWRLNHTDLGVPREYISTVRSRVRNVPRCFGVSDVVYSYYESKSNNFASKELTRLVTSSIR